MSCSDLNCFQIDLKLSDKLENKLNVQGTDITIERNAQGTDITIKRNVQGKDIASESQLELELAFKD